MSAFERVERRETVTTEAVWRGADPTPTLASRTTTVTRYTVTGAEAVTMHDDNRGRLYVPVSVAVQRFGASTPDVTVGGRLQRKDGSLGASVHELHRYRWQHKGWPEWLADIVRDSLGVTK